MGIRVENPKKQFSLTLNPETVEFLRELATSEKRTLSSYLNLLLTAYVEDVKKEGHNV